MSASRKSVQLTLLLTDFIILAVAAAAVGLPWLTEWYITSMKRPEDLRTVILTVCYACLPAAAAALYSLRRLLKNIIKGETFVKSNVRHLRLLSWYCAAVSLITLAAGYFYLPFYIIGTAAGFFMLILRVLKNVFCSAIEIKAENELTI